MSENIFPKKFIRKFWSRIEILDDSSCWFWEASKNAYGYGLIPLKIGKRQYKLLLAHRVSYIIANGDIPEGYVIRHKCDNPPCVNPNHLEIGTQGDNMRDKVERNRCNTSFFRRDGISTKAPIHVAEIPTQERYFY